MEVAGFLIAYEEVCGTGWLGDTGGAPDEYGRTEVNRSVVEMEGLKVASLEDRPTGGKGGAGLEGRGEMRGGDEEDDKAGTGGAGQQGSGAGVTHNHHHFLPYNLQGGGTGAEEDPDKVNKRDAFEKAMRASIKARMKSVSVKDVQESVFELVKEVLSLEHATFLRGRLISVIRGAAIFMTSGGSFHKTLLKMHDQYLTAKNVAGGVAWIRELLWPGGEWGEAGEELDLEQKVSLATEVHKQLHGAIPEQVISIVGADLGREGADVLFEVMQNDIVLRSIAYQLLDLILLEAYPELKVDLDALHSVED